MCDCPKRDLMQHTNWQLFHFFKLCNFVGISIFIYLPPFISNPAITQSLKQMPLIGHCIHKCNQNVWLPINKSWHKNWCLSLVRHFLPPYLEFARHFLFILLTLNSLSMYLTNTTCVQVCTVNVWWSQNSDHFLVYVKFRVFGWMTKNEQKREIWAKCKFIIRFGCSAIFCCCCVW